MKDLKHLNYFENLLQDSGNELVDKARAAGSICIGTTCYQIPEVLLNLTGCFAVRMRAPRTGSMEMGTYYMTSLNCEFARALLERCLEGGYGFLDCIIEPFACSQMTSTMENIEKLHLCDKDKPDFFVQHVDTPIKADENAVRHLTRLCRARILEKLHETFGTDVSDAALRDAVMRYNEICDVINEIGSYRKLDDPTITGYEFAVLCLATYCAPWELVIEKLRETARELKTRKPDAKKQFRIKAVLAGSEIDDPDFVKLIEDAGVRVVADRHCFGSFPGRMPIELNDADDVLEQICRHYVMQCQCPRYMDNDRIAERKAYLDRLAHEYDADGIILQQMNFCNFWPYERAGASQILSQEYGWPVLSIDRPYAAGSSGQIRTRIQAFVESVEIKRLQGGKS